MGGGKKMTWTLTLDFFTGNQEAKEDESLDSNNYQTGACVNGQRATHHYGRGGNRDPPQGLPNLEGKDQAVYDSDDPQMDGVREWNGSSQNTLETGQGVGEGEQGIQQTGYGG